MSVLVPESGGSVFRHLQEAEWPESSPDSCIKIAAIDNGLAFPFKHPDEWRACMSRFLFYFEMPFLFILYSVFHLKWRECSDAEVLNLLRLMVIGEYFFR